jgi:cytochrome c oxidase assembly protein subunit 15
MDTLAPGRTAASTPSRGAARMRRGAPVATWLFACCALVFAMVVVGGATRLTHSGLSITEWAPIVGTMPPLSDADWQQAFAKYRATPEYRDVNHGMSLAEFKGIFWWEYFHRLLGRAIGVAFLVPYLYFLARRRLPEGYALPLAGIFVLGGMQGALGWYMVQSGLVDNPRVSHFRLTAHLGLALAIFTAMLWTALSLAAPAPALPNTRRARTLRGATAALVALVFVQALAGGLVAGLRAGFAYNTFPLMNGSLVPPELLMLEPAWKNVFWNMATVQFDHRMLAWVLVAVVAWLWWRVRADDTLSARARGASHLVLAALAIQFVLGAATVVLVVPLPLAVAHQAGAVALLAAAVAFAHATSGAPRR